MAYEELIIFDLDDTLIDTSDVYWRARERFVRELAAVGIAPEEAIEEFERVDATQISHFGFSPLRYGKSMTITYRRLLEQQRRPPSEEALSRIETHGRYILDNPPEPIEGAVHLLRWASTRFELALLTRGDDTFQRRKLEHAGLVEFFDAVEVVSKKTPEIFGEFVRHLGYRPENTWIVGDSIRSDINPGLEIGATCILYRYKHASYHWRQEHGDRSIGVFYEAGTLQEVKDILEASTRQAAATHL